HAPGSRAMGPIRLGALQRTRKWQAVVALLAGGAGANQIANATIGAAERDLSRAGADEGLIEVVWLRTQLPHGARSEDFPRDRRRCGLAVSDSPGLAVAGPLADGRPLPRAEILAADFAGMGWTVQSGGTRAVVYAGQGTKDHLRAALQLL